MDSIKVAIADDHQIFRKGVILSLRPYHNIKFVLEAENGEELIKGVESAMPDIVLMDLKMPIMDGMEATKEVRKKFNSIKVLVVTMYEDDKFIIHMMEMGANGYLLKNADSAEIVKSIYSVHETGYYFNDLVSEPVFVNC